MSTRNRLTNRVATATPLQSYCRNPHRIPDRLMYNTGAAMGEKTSKEQKVMASTRTHALTMSTRIALRNRVATSTPLQKYCRHPHRIPERLMYSTGAATSEKTSKEQKVNASTSPVHQKSS